MTYAERAPESDIAARVLEVRKRIAAACDRAGRPVESVTLVAASKTRQPPQIIEALVAGVHDFGENRPEEAAAKMSVVEAAAKAAGLELPSWHMIGHIQSRKAPLVVGSYRLVHSLDSLRLGKRLSRLAVAAGEVLDCLVEVNVSGEASKYGFAAPGADDLLPEPLLESCRVLLDLPGLRIRGLMTVPPPAERPEWVRPYFRRLRALRDQLADQLPQADWSELSMGMTDDFEVAILEGATLVRVGRAIFGPRLP